MTNRTTLQLLAEQAEKAVVATGQRNYWIVQARAEGASLRTIATAAGLTHGAIAYILRTAEAQPRRNQ